MKRTIKLPRKPSDLLALALNDLRKVEKSKKYRVGMYVWHRPALDSTPCEVCMAGAVMAKTLGVSRYESRLPDSFPPPVECKLDALDAFRNYMWRSGFSEMGVSESRSKKACDALCSIHDKVSHEKDLNGFHRNMRKAVRIMRTHGV